MGTLLSVSGLSSAAHPNPIAEQRQDISHSLPRSQVTENPSQHISNPKTLARSLLHPLSSRSTAAPASLDWHCLRCRDSCAVLVPLSFSLRNLLSFTNPESTLHSLESYFRPNPQSPSAPRPSPSLDDFTHIRQDQDSSGTISKQETLIDLLTGASSSKYIGCTPRSCVFVRVRSRGSKAPPIFRYTSAPMIH